MPCARLIRMCLQHFPSLLPRRSPSILPVSYTHLQQNALDSLIAKAKKEEDEAEKKKAAAAASKNSNVQTTTSTGTTNNGAASNVQASDLDMLAAIIYCEAGSEGYDGQLAVGAVVMNRVRSSSYPTVSYTHLDVYKIQPGWSEPEISF